MQTGRRLSMKLLLLSLLLSVFMVEVCGVRCEKTGPCSCRTDDGVIDLSPLDSNNSIPRFYLVPDVQGAAFYSWNPCTSFTQLDNCRNVAACQFEYGTNVTKNIGTQDSAAFVTTPKGELTLQYYYFGAGQNSTTVVTLECGGDHDQLSVYGEQQEGIYSMALTSKYACVKPVPDDVRDIAHDNKPFKP